MKIFKKNTIYYGGGYHAIEKNTNKTIEGRLTVRPYVQSLPRLQLIYLGAFGKRNKENIPKWRLNSFFLSWEHSTFVLTEMYFLGKGNSYGSAIDATGLALSQDGYSIFGKYKFINSNLRLIGRYDFFNSEYIPKDIVRERYITGCAYHFLHGCNVLLNYDMLVTSRSTRTNESIFESADEVRYKKQNYRLLF